MYICFQVFEPNEIGKMREWKKESNAFVVYNGRVTGSSKPTKSTILFIMQKIKNQLSNNFEIELLIALISL